MNINVDFKMKTNTQNKDNVGAKIIFGNTSAE